MTNVADNVILCYYGVSSDDNGLLKNKTTKSALIAQIGTAYTTSNVAAIGTNYLTTSFYMPFGFAKATGIRLWAKTYQIKGNYKLYIFYS